MYIKSFELKNVRGISHLRAAALPETGVIVIHGSNEAGKSTIAEAIKIALTESHTSRSNRPRGGFANYGAAWLKSVTTDAGPEITIELSVGDYELTFVKGFFKNKQAKLTVTAPRHESLTGAKAEDRLKEILADNVELDLLNAMFLRQGQEGEALKAMGLESLKSALRASSGISDDESTREDSALGARVREEYEKYFTIKQAKPSKAYAKALERQDTARADLDAAAAEVRSLQSHVEAVEQAIKSLADAKAALPKAVADVAEKQEAAEQAAKVHGELEQATTELERAKTDKARALEDAKRRTDMVAQLREAEEELEKLQPKLQAAQEEADAEEDRHAAAQQEVETARAQREQAREKVAAAKKHCGVAKDVELKESLTARVTQLEGLHAAVTEAKNAKAARGKTVTDKDVTRAETADYEWTVAKEKQQAAASKLVLTSPEPATVGVDGHDVELRDDEEFTVSLRDGTVVDIAGVQARFVSGAGATQDWDARVTAAEEAFRDIMAEFDCETVAQLRAKRDEHREADSTLDRARADYKAALAGDDFEELQARLAALRTAVEGAEVPAHSVEEAESLLAAAEKDLTSAEHAVEKAEIALVSVNSRSAEIALVEMTQKVKSVQETIERLSTDLEQAEEQCTLDTLQARVVEAGAKVGQLDKEHARIAALVKEANPELTQKLLAGAQAKQKSIEKRITEADRAIWQNNSHIESAQGAEERLATAQAELDAATARLASVERRAKAAARLMEVMDAHRDEARKRYAAPFSAKLEEFARVIFGNDCALELDEDLQVHSRTKDGATVSLDNLSGGAKEQMGLLTRFAIASLIGTAEDTSVPILVDDALGSTDPHRLELMATLFTDVGQQGQVIVLTCMPQRYESIPGHTSINIETLKGE